MIEILFVGTDLFIVVTGNFFILVGTFLSAFRTTAFKYYLWQMFEMQMFEINNRRITAG